MITIKGQKDYLVALESVAMTDIVLNMFIFFFISFSLLYTLAPERLAKLEVNLPKASHATALTGTGNAVVTVAKDGSFSIEGERRDAPGLRRALSGALKDNPSLGVTVTVDAAAAFDHVAKALDIIQGLDIHKVSVAVAQEHTK